MGYLLNKNFSVKGGVSVMKQYLHLLTFASLGLPSDIWLPVTSKIKPRYSYQYALSFIYNDHKAYEVTLELYYKTLNNIYGYKDGVDYLSVNNTWQDKIQMGNGLCNGIELLIKRTKGKITGWLSYALTKSERKFDNINNGETFPYKYDRTHSIDLVLKYQIKPRLFANLYWVYGTGLAMSLAKEKYAPFTQTFNWFMPEGIVNTDPVLHYEKRNNHRMPPYHRLDISLTFERIKKRGKSSWNFGVYNVYNRYNPFLLYYDDNKIKQVAILPIIPFINYSFTF